ncbi:carbonic anhydrase [Aspergillus luchuensis]|uniref:Carbonic anhydrase n=1 Tax=Aspergillus kawachii TaxID=1069201 RepID=A0A146EX93_ASPKA|nr:carbonic anhydrase [Aspergillus luchuensis]
MRSLFTEQDDHDVVISTNFMRMIYITDWQDINAQRYTQRKNCVHTPDLAKTISTSQYGDTTIVSPIDWLEGIVSSKNLFLITANGQHPLPQDAGLVLELFMVQAIRVDWLSSLFSRPSRKRLTTS